MSETKINRLAALEAALKLTGEAASGGYKDIYTSELLRKNYEMICAIRTEIAESIESQ